MNHVRGVLCQIQSSVIGCALAGIVASSALAQGGPPPALVRVDPVKMESVERLREVTGEVRPIRRALVASQEAGIVLQLEVDVGSTVRTGEVLARLDQTRRKLDVAQLAGESAARQAEVQEREAEVTKAQRDVRRLEALEQEQSASQTEIDDAQTELVRTQARLAQATADLESALAQAQLARARLEDMVIGAPFDGEVVKKATEVGQWVREGDTVVELVDLTQVDVFLDVPERYIEHLDTSESAVQLRVDALDLRLPVENVKVIAQGDRLARTFPVRLRIDNPNGRLRPGMSATGLVPTGEPMQALTIHKDAIMRSDVGVFVWMNAGGKATPAPVELLFAVGERLVVRSQALREGAQVVIEGNERLYPGQPLTVDGDIADKRDQANGYGDPQATSKGGR